MPNGQKVTLEDVKGLASREWVGEMLYKPNSAVTRVQSPNKRNVVQLEDGEQSVLKTPSQTDIVLR